MRKSRKFISLPIISLEEGQKIGVIKDIIIDPIRKELAAILVEQRGWFKEQKIIPYSKVRSAGVDAITVEKSSSVDKAANFPGIMGLINDKIALIGARVITETGVIIGQVDEFWVDELSGKLIALDITGNLFNSILKGTGQLSVEHIRTIGPDVLVACEGAETLLTNLDGGLQDRVKNLKDITSQLFSATWEKTKNLGKLVDEEYEQLVNAESASPKADTDMAASQKDGLPIDHPLPDGPEQQRVTSEDPDQVVTEEVLPANTPETELAPVEVLPQPLSQEQSEPKEPPTLN